MPGYSELFCAGWQKGAYTPSALSQTENEPPAPLSSPSSVAAAGTRASRADVSGGGAADAAPMSSVAAAAAAAVSSLGDVSIVVVLS